MLRMEDLPNVNTAATCDDGGTDPEMQSADTITLLLVLMMHQESLMQ
jgi:hypothetical protein